ncbi:MAG TPA: thymidylate synthase [Thermoguttaceae bacterium]|nr:thymidylate synthase [Thermoguttaceae bacterium]
MNGIPVLSAEGDCIARAWENSLVALYKSGCLAPTEYDQPGDPPSKDATMTLVVHEPLREPMIHKDLPGGFEDLEEYVMEVLDGIKDHLVRDPSDPTDTRWEYTYHQRLSSYDVPTLPPIDQIDRVVSRLAKAPHTRRAQAITWKVWEDVDCYDPACLQSIWCRITPEEAGPVLNMNVRFRSNDAYKAALMNIFALVRLQEKIAGGVAEVSGVPVRLGRYCHMADSYHIYGKDLPEFEARFLGAIRKRTFPERTVRYEDVKPIMDEARPAILEKARKMRRGNGGNNA